MKHLHLAPAQTGTITHLSGEEWTTAVGDYNKTQISLKRDDDYGNQFEFSICDNVNLRSNFGCKATLDEIERIGAAITRLVQSARAEKANQIERQRRALR